MSGTPEFALVLDPATFLGMGGTETWGVCRVMEDGADTGFFEDRNDALDFVAGLPVVPRLPGVRTVSVPYDLEVEVISLLVDAAASLRGVPAEVPPAGLEGFRPVVPASFGGFVVLTGDHGLEFSFGAALARGLGWAAGSRIALQIDGHGKRLALVPSEQGVTLVRSAEGPLETEHALPYPLEMIGTVPGKRLLPPYEVHGDGIVFRTPETAPEAVPSALARQVPPDATEERAPPSLDAGSVVLGFLLASAVLLLGV